MKLELQDEKGLTGVFIELPLEQVREGLGLSSSSAAESTAVEAQLKEKDDEIVQLKESQGKVAELEEKLARAEARTMDDFTQIEKANFVIAWGKGLSPERKAFFATAVGLPIAGATDAEVAEAGGEPAIIAGKTDKPGYRYLEHINISVKE